MNPKEPEKIKEVNCNPRRFGDKTSMIVDFFLEGERGKSVIFSTPQGNFLAPKAAENMRTSAYQQGVEDGSSQSRKELIEEIEKMKRYSGKHNAAHTFIQDGFCHGCNSQLSHKQLEEEFGYNQAIEDISSLLKESTEECKCACHENKLKRPYEHDRRCCDDMNGFVSTEEKVAQPNQEK